MFNFSRLPFPRPRVRSSQGTYLESQQERVTVTPVLTEEGRYSILLCPRHNGWSPRVDSESQVSKITLSQCVCTNWCVHRLKIRSQGDLQFDYDEPGLRGPFV